MDARSDRKLISGNQTWSNDGDGIVVQNSAHVVRSNTVTGNRVGVRVNGVAGHRDRQPARRQPAGRRGVRRAGHRGGDVTGNDVTATAWATGSR